MLFITTRCATTKLSSIKNPDVQGIKLHKIMIVAPFSDIGTRRNTEEAFVKNLNAKCYYYKKIDSYGVCSIDIIPPFKEYSYFEVEKKMLDAEVDGILVVALEDYWTSQAYVPKSSEESGEFKFYGNSLSYKSYTKEHGGYYISKPRVKFDIRLFAVDSGEIIWMGTSVTKGNAFANYGTLLESLSKSVVDDLHKKGILKEK
jgi:hypothetical protein